MNSANGVPCNLSALYEHCTQKCLWLAAECSSRCMHPLCRTVEKDVLSVGGRRKSDLVIDIEPHRNNHSQKGIGQCQGGARPVTESMHFDFCLELVGVQVATFSIPLWIGRLVHEFLVVWAFEVKTLRVNLNLNPR